MTLAVEPPNTEARRRQLYALLGDLPDRNRSITATLVAEDITWPYVLEKLLRYDIGHFETAAMRAEIVAFLAKSL